LPFPSYPGLRPFVDAIKGLLDQYPTGEFNPTKGTERLTKAGWAKGGNGLWAKDGQSLKLDILGTIIFSDIGPVVVEQLKRQGIEATFAMPPDANDRFAKGNYQGMLFGHGGSVNADPYNTLRLYQSTTASGTVNTTQANFSRWTNAEYDKIVDEMAITPIEDQKKLLDLFRRAMEIWLPALPDVQVTEWYHRIPMNTTYWKGWPTKEDPYVNGAFWALTGQLVIGRLEPAQ
jgi:peptide/nickel transport system substrate-binding protein